MARDELEYVQALMNDGHLMQARVLCAPICQDKTTASARAWLTLGAIDELQGATDESLDAIRQAIKLQPDLAEAHLALGRLLEQQGRRDEAIACFKHAIVCDPDNCATHLCLASALERLGRHSEAIGHFKTVLTFDPDNADAITGAGMCYLKFGDNARGDAQFRQALELDAVHPGALRGLGYSALVRKNFVEAMRYFQTVLDGNKNSAEAHYDLGTCLVQQGNAVDALKYLREAARLAPDHLAARTGILSLLLAMGKRGKVLDACNDVLKLQPDNLDVLALSVQTLVRNGEYELAAKRLHPVMDVCNKNVRAGLALAALADYLDQNDHAITCLEQLIANGKVQTDVEQQRVLFSLGRLCDKVGAYDKAFGYYRKGNDMAIKACKRTTIENRTRQGQERVNALTSCHSIKLHPGLPHASNTSQLPVFIIGMPRSGTTLVEQILDSHPEIHGAGELNLLPVLADTLQARPGSPVPYPLCLSSITDVQLDEIASKYLERLVKLGGHARRVTDKMPGNYKLLGLIDLLFPGARIIHCIRNPLDTCLSIYFQDFQQGETYSGDLTDIGHIYLQYRQLMDHWQNTLSIPIMDVHYEELIKDQEGMSRKLIDFCGLAWDKQCLKFYESGRTIRTASYDQANKPIYRDSIERWRNYDPWLGPLRDVLGIQNRN